MKYVLILAVKYPVLNFFVLDILDYLRAEFVKIFVILGYEEKHKTHYKSIFSDKQKKHIPPF